MVSIAGTTLCPASAEVFSQFLRNELSKDPSTDQDLIQARQLRQVASEPVVLDILTQAELSRSKKYENSLKLKEAVFIKEGLTTSEEGKLRSDFPDFNIKFLPSCGSGPHAFARAHRKLSYLYMIRKLGITNTTKPVNGYDAVLKDVGGNPIPHHNNCEIYVHTCFPVLDNNDDYRHSNYFSHLRNYKQEGLTKLQTLCHQLHIESNRRVICHNPSQHCTVTAMNMCFLHSCYDIEDQAIALMMAKSKTLNAIGCFHFTPDILLYPKGRIEVMGLNWEKFVRNGRVVIKFFFDSDYQEAYVHDYQTYISKLRTRRLSCIYNGVVHHYNFQLTVSKSDVLFFEIKKSISGCIPKCIVTNVITCRSMDDKLIMHYYKWDTLKAGIFNRDSNHMVPIRLYVSKRLYEGLVSYALVLPEGKFTIKNLMTAGMSMNTREVIDGKSVGVVQRMSPHDVQHLVHAVFLEVYILQYEASKVTSFLMNQENSVRKQCDDSYFKRALNKLIFKSKSLPVDPDVLRRIDEEECPTKSGIREFIDKLSELGNVERDFKTLVSGSQCKFITLESEVEVFCERESHDSGMHTTQVSDTLDPEKVRQAIVDQLGIIEGTIYTDSDFLDCECCDNQFTEKPNSSDGDCIYTSMRDHSITEESISDIKRRLKRSQFLTSIGNYEEVKKNLSAESGSLESYGTLKNFLLISLEYGITICIHTDSRYRKFGSGPKYHFNIRNNHCQALLVEHELPVALEVKLSHSQCRDVTYQQLTSVKTTASRIEVTTRMFDEERKINEAKQNSKTNFSNRVKTAECTVDELYTLKNCSFSSREGLKISELMYRHFRNSTFDSAVLMFHDESVLQGFIKHSSAQVLSITPPMCYVSEISFPDVIPVMSDSFDEEWLSLENLNHYRVNICSEMYRKGVDFFLGDGIKGSRDERTFDLPLNIKEFCASVLMCLSVIRKRGDALFRTVDLTAVQSVNAIVVLCEVFEEVTLVHPSTSRPMSGETYIICKNFKSSRKVRLDYLYLHWSDSDYNVPSLLSQELCGTLDNYNSLLNIVVRRSTQEFCRHIRKASTPKQHQLTVDPYTAESFNTLLGITVTDEVLAGGIRNVLLEGFNKIKSTFVSPNMVPDFSVDVGDDSDSDDSFVSACWEADVETLNEPLVSSYEEKFDSVFDCFETQDECIVEETPVTVSRVTKTIRKINRKFKRKAPQPPGFEMVVSELPVIHTGITWKPQPCVIRTEPVETSNAVNVKNITPPPSYDSLVTPTAPALEVNDVAECMTEFLNYLLFTHNSEVSNLQLFSRRCLYNGLGNPNNLSNLTKTVRGYGPGNFGVVSRRTLEYIISPNVPSDKGYNKFFYGGKLYTKEELNDVPCDYVIVNDYCILGLEKEMYDSLVTVFDPSYTLEGIDVGVIQAGPGCGKTTEIISTHTPVLQDKVSTVLLSTVEGKDDFCRRVCLKHGLDKEDKTVKTALKTYYRTMASYLLNIKNNNCTETLYVDEARMSHPGAVLFAIKICKPKFVRCLGDNMQIPFVNRTPDFSLKYPDLNKFVPVVKCLKISYRCPLDVVSRIEPMYRQYSEDGVGLKSANIKYETCQLIKINDERGLPAPTKSDDKLHVKYLTFTQSDKEVLRLRGYDVSTVHEFQGKENPRVSVVRLNPYPQENIFLNDSYALVAISRHTVSFIYYTKILTDSLSRLIVSYRDLTRQQVDRLAEMRIGGLKEIFPIFAPQVNTCYATFEMRTGKLYRSAIDEVHFVPRYGRYPWNPSFTPTYTKGVVVSRGNRKNVIFIESSDERNKNPNIKVIKRSLYGNKHLIPSKFGICDNIFKFIQHSTVAAVFYKFNRTTIYVYSDTYVDDIEPQVFELLNKNALIEMPNSEVKTIAMFLPEVVECETVCARFDIASCQRFLVSFFSGCFVDQKLDSWMLHNYDLILQSGGYSYVGIRGLDYRKNYDGLSPVLKTPMYQLRAYTSRELRVAVEKRNLAVPKLSGTVNIEDVSTKMVDNIILRCFDEKKLSEHLAEPLFVSANDIHSWLKNQNTNVVEQIVPDFALHMSAINEYCVSIKKNPKPSLTIDAHKTYAALQTIVYHSKHINAMFCAIFRKIKTRILACLKPHILLYCDLSPLEFEEKLNQNIDRVIAVFSGDDSYISDGDHNLEIDISKYDKSQGWLALEYDCKILRKFGCPEEFVQLWYNGHILTNLYDVGTGFKCLIPFQRKSGDASTFILNTMFTLGVAAYKIPLDELENIDLRKYVDPSLFCLLFNLEVKFFSYNYPYFCSKFLLRTPNGWKFTPDPLKLLVKLGRSDMVNEEHVECYRISFEDNVKNFSNLNNCRMISEALNERYNMVGDHTMLLASFPDLAKKENFHSLYYRDPESKIDERRYDLSIKD